MTPAFERTGIRCRPSRMTGNGRRQTGDMTTRDISSGTTEKTHGDSFELRIATEFQRQFIQLCSDVLNRARGAVRLDEFRVRFRNPSEMT